MFGPCLPMSVWVGFRLRKWAPRQPLADLWWCCKTACLGKEQLLAVELCSKTVFCDGFRGNVE